jgi:hypothetical protein
VNASSETSTMGSPRKGFWVRHGWKFLLGLALVIGLFGVGDALIGLDADPAIPEGVTGMSPDEMRESSPDIARLADLQVRAGGIQLMVIATLWTLILVFPFRRGQVWAWWSMWTFPGWALAVAVMFLLVELQPGQPTPPPAISGWIFFGLTALLLLLTKRGFSSPT